MQDALVAKKIIVDILYVRVILSPNSITVNDGLVVIILALILLTGSTVAMIIANMKDKS